MSKLELLQQVDLQFLGWDGKQSFNNTNRLVPNELSNDNILIINVVSIYIL